MDLSARLGAPAGGFPRAWTRSLGVTALTVGAVAAGQRDALLPPRWPAAVALVAAAPFVVSAVRGRLHSLVYPAVAVPATWVLISERSGNDAAPFFLVLVVMRLAAVDGAAAGAVGAAGASSVVAIADLHGLLEGGVLWIVGIAISAFGGVGVRSYRRLADELQATQQVVAERAAEAERERIARELHDLIAHSLSVTVLQLSGARVALEGRDLDEASQAIADAELVSRESLADIRRTVGMLARAGEDRNRALPTADDIPGLVEQFAAAGLDVTFECVPGTLNSLSPAVGLSLFRVTQEALANVAKHAAGFPAAVRVTRRDGGIELSVRNPLPQRQAPPHPSPDGMGLTGIRQRAESAAGWACTGGDGSEWSVLVWVPLEAPT